MTQVRGQLRKTKKDTVVGDKGECECCEDWCQGNGTMNEPHVLDRVAARNAGERCKGQGRMSGASSREQK